MINLCFNVFFSPLTLSHDFLLRVTLPVVFPFFLTVPLLFLSPWWTRSKQRKLTLYCAFRNETLQNETNKTKKSFNAVDPPFCYYFSCSFRAIIFWTFRESVVYVSSYICIPSFFLQTEFK